MKKIKNKYKNIMEGSDKKTLIVYVILRMLVILCMIRELMNENFQNALLCILSLFLFLLPAFIEKTFKVELPNTLEIIILVFILKIKNI